AAKQRFELLGGAGGLGLFDSFLCDRAAATQVEQRRKDVLFYVGKRRPGGFGGLWRSGPDESVKLVPQLNDNAFGCLLADTRNTNQRLDGSLPDSADKVRGRESRQRDDRQLRTNAAYGNQLFE